MEHLLKNPDLIPTLSMPEFKEFLEKLEHSLRTRSVTRESLVKILEINPSKFPFYWHGLAALGFDLFHFLGEDKGEKNIKFNVELYVESLDKDTKTSPGLSTFIDNQIYYKFDNNRIPFYFKLKDFYLSKMIKDTEDKSLEMHPLEQDLPDKFSEFDTVKERFLELIPVDPFSSNEHYISIKVGNLKKKESTKLNPEVKGNYCFDSRMDNYLSSNYTREFIPFSKLKDKLPEGIFLTNNLGGTLYLSTTEEKKVWKNEVNLDDINKEFKVDKRLEILRLEHSTHEIIPSNNIFFLTSNIFYESGVVDKDSRSIIIEVTLAHDYPNRLIQPQNQKH